ncbi:MAG: long-chain fatty acid--CoA ligase, partial [Aurantimicrobium sp.]
MASSIIQFDTPALVPADPQANTTQVLLDRIRETPNGALFSIPVGDGWQDVTSTEFYNQVVALAKGFIASG